MKADLSRDTFDRARHYDAVRLQQGRIVTDADWNEQADITRYRAGRLARDTIGRCGAPIDAAGFRLVAETNALAVAALNANVAWIAAQDGVLLTTSNGGTDWTDAELPTATHLRAVAHAGNTGWVVGDGGVVFNSSDSGLNWVARNTGSVHALRGIAAVDADHAWAVGDGGVVLSTEDGGVGWTLAQTPAARLYAVSFADAFDGLAVGQGGAIVSSRDGGANWSAVASGTRAHLRAMARFDASRVWIAGQGGTILRSEDGGANWLPCSTPTTATLHAIIFRDSGEGWAVGDGAAVLHSADGGATWQQASPAVGGATLRGLALFDHDPAWAAGDGSVVLRLGTGSPDVAETLALPAFNLSIEPGRYWVDGMLCELESRSSYANQPDGGSDTRLAPGAHLLYLDVWQRHVSALEAPAIREVALGGPDTATRARTVARLRALPLPVASPFDWNCDSQLEAWDALVRMPRPLLAARAEPQPAAANLCEIAATAGYRRLENQLYRVEVHEGGATPGFKWSRENGSIAYAVVGVVRDVARQQTTVRVAARGRDSNLDVAVGDRVELVDDEAELTQRAGTLLEYIGDGDDALELVLAGLPPGTLGQDPSRHPMLRRWDQSPAAGTNVMPIVEGAWIDLEDGVQVRFEPGGEYRPGDYWQIPARTITADVEWPRDDDGEPVARMPDGIDDAYCRLGIVEVAGDGTIAVASDCRELFPPLTALAQLLYVGGDGQDAAPNALLPQPLALRVARGSAPVAGARIRFEIDDSGGGSVGAGSGGSSWMYETTTDADGVASCRWTLGPGSDAPARHQRVRARLLDADGQPLAGQQIVYGATATVLMQYVSGDGQQAAPSAALAHPLEVRIVNGGDGIAGVPLIAAVEQGSGTLTGPADVTTDSEGYAAFGWQLGSSGPQRVAVSIADEAGSVLQRLAFNATIANGVTRPAGGGCDVTIGKGGDFEKLDNELLDRLLQRTGALCLCFLPGEHELDDIEFNEGRRGRLSLHGCGPTARLRIKRGVLLAGFEVIELRDLSIELAGDAGVALRGNDEARVAGSTITRAAQQSNEPGLLISGSRTVRMTGCDIDAGPPAALVFEDIVGDCHVIGSRFAGAVSFYGRPGGDLSQELLEALRDAREMRLAPKAARLRFCDNSVRLLTVGLEMTKRLIETRGAEAIFQTALLHGNTFESFGNIFASGLLSFEGNSFIAAPRGGIPPYGVMVANRAAAAGNVAIVFGDQAILHFLTPADGGFRGAGNQVFTLPQS